MTPLLLRGTGVARVPASQSGGARGRCRDLVPPEVTTQSVHLLVATEVHQILLRDFRQRCHVLQGPSANAGLPHLHAASIPDQVEQLLLDRVALLRGRTVPDPDPRVVPSASCWSRRIRRWSSCAIAPCTV